MGILSLLSRAVSPAVLYDDGEFIIRSLEERDLPALEWDGLYATFRRLFRQAFEDMLTGSRLLLVLERKADPEIIGQVFLQWNSSDPRLADGRHRGYLYALRVKAPYQGRGLGTRLIRVAEESLGRRGMRIVSIGVGKNNLRARTLYERLGYRTVGEDPGCWSYIDHRGIEQQVSEPAWLMEKDLSLQPEKTTGAAPSGQ